MAMAMRWLRHVFAPSAARRFPADRLQRIAGVIAEGEGLHDGEVVFAVEAGLPMAALVAGTTPRERAGEVFAQLRVWDTEANNGVLLYLLLADQAIEIVADRGLQARVTGAEWQAVCRAVENGIGQGGRDGMEAAVIDGIVRISTLLAAHFPAGAGGRDELPDRPVLL
jgi:uncharacterized membrane protein